MLLYRLKLCSCTGSNYAPVQAQINSIVLNNIFQISSKSSTYNICNKIVPEYRIGSTIQTVVHGAWMKLFLMCSQPATFTGLSFTISLLHMGMNVAALVHCIVVPFIIHSCACAAIHKGYLTTSQ